MPNYCELIPHSTPRMPTVKIRRKVPTNSAVSLAAVLGSAMVCLGAFERDAAGPMDLRV